MSTIKVCKNCFPKKVEEKTKYYGVGTCAACEAPESPEPYAQQPNAPPGKWATHSSNIVDDLRAGAENSRRLSREPLPPGPRYIVSPAWVAQIEARLSEERRRLITVTAVQIVAPEPGK